MTAGREQDAREALRTALIDAYERGHEDAEEGRGFHSHAAADAIAALLPSPPATTGAGAAMRGHHHGPRVRAEQSCPECWPPAPTPPGGDDGAPAPGVYIGSNGAQLVVPAPPAASSPPATDGDAAGRCDGSRYCPALSHIEGCFWNEHSQWSTPSPVGATETGTPGPAAGGGDDE